MTFFQNVARLIFAVRVRSFVTVYAQLFFRVPYAVRWYTFEFVSCFRTILSSSNGNICYSLYTLSAVVVSHFASHTLVTVGLSFS